MTLQLAFFVSFLLTVILTFLSIKIIKKIGLLDDPGKRKHPAVIHSKPIPRGGGIPLFLGIFVTCLFFLPITKITIALFVASLISLIVGIMDDLYDISPYARFVANIASALIVVLSGISIPYITNPFGGIIYLDSIKVTIFTLSDILAIFWIVWVMNMLNWSKGVDGQMPGIVAISAFVIGILSLRFANFDYANMLSANLSFIIAGAALGFLIFNFYPARIFPGYGATAVYLLLSAASILSGAKLATAILVMGIPMTDGIFTIIRRLLSGRSPFWHDKKHLHHLLLGIGVSQRGIALFYWTNSAILGSLALILSSKGKLFAIIMLMVVVLGTLLFLNRVLKKNI